MATFNVINITLGAGVIGLPYATQQAGVGVAVILFVVIGIISDSSLVKLAQAGELSTDPKPTYQSLMKKAFGKPGFLVISCIQFAHAFIGMVGYNVVFGDTLTTFLATSPTSLVGRRDVLIVGFTLLVTLPLSLYREIAKLSKWAAFGSLLILLLVVFVCVRFATLNLPAAPGSYSFSNHEGLLKAVSIISSAYMCHHSAFLLYDSLEEPTVQRWSRVVHVSVGFNVGVSIILALAGYATFTADTQGDLLENYCRDDLLMNIGRVVFAISVMMSFPAQSFVTREVLENALFPHAQPPTLRRHVVATVGLVLSAMVLSLLTDCIGVVLELNGALTAVPIIFILPPLLMLKLQNSPILRLANLPLVLTIGFGLFCCVLGLVLTAREILREGAVRCTSDHDPDFCLSTPVYNVTVGNVTIKT